MRHRSSAIRLLARGAQALLLVLALAVPMQAWALTITIDGDDDDWGSYTPQRDNYGQVIQITGAGQIIWWDPEDDERTDFDGNDSELDLTELRVTGDATNLYFLAHFADLVTSQGDGVTQVQIALDGPGDGTRTGFFMANAETNVGPGAEWTRLLQTRFGSNSGLAVYQTDSLVGVQPGGAALGTTADVIEIGVSWASLGLPDGPPAEPLRFTIGVFRSNATDGTFDVSGSEGLSDAMDAVTNYGVPGMVGNTFDDVTDGTLDYFFDAWLDATGEPYSPLLVNEIDADTPSADTAEFVELASSGARVAVDLTDWLLQLVEGAGASAGTVDRTVPLAAVALDPDSFFVVCANAAFVPGCDLDVVPDTSLIENGPDAVGLMLRGIVMDTVGYGSVVAGAAPYVEGAAAQTELDSPARGLSRISALAPDTHDNLTDVKRRCITPGADNNATLDSSSTCHLCGNSATESTELCDAGPLNGGNGSCCSDVCDFEPALTVCREVALGDACDVEEVCPGGSGLCPADDFEPDTTECRPSVGDCDIAESCTGADPACPIDALEPDATQCRPADDLCDAAESCTGDDPDCPADDLEPGGTVCREAAGDCDVAEECTGDAAACPEDVLADSDTECRAEAGDCDLAENCAGDDPDCPADERVASGVSCRASAGDCDIGEDCNGTDADCPADEYEADTVECRPADGDCDVAEDCPGDGADCPTDGFALSSVECLAADGDCDVAESCPGNDNDCPADGFAASTVECRSAAGECDVAESCSGSDGDCPADAFADEGDPCGDQDEDCHLDDACDDAGTCVDAGFEDSGTGCADATFCNGDETCDNAGVCSSPGDPCDVGETCSEADDVCQTIPADCGDGTIEGDEACDDGDDNSDTEPDACRLDCTLARCGDSVVDSGESCDDGPDNSDTEPDACRTNCALATCGNGDVDDGEACDDGADNSDTAADACRTTCVLAYCGDAVIDAAEICDDGPDNSDTEPDACRLDCQAPICGDGVVDTDEECDEGDDNGNADPATCSLACVVRQSDDVGGGDAGGGDVGGGDAGLGDAGVGDGGGGDGGADAGGGQTPTTSSDAGCCAVAGGGGGAGVPLGLLVAALLTARRKARPS